MKVIDRFIGNHAFLSNFYPSIVVFPTVEHHYQAAKTIDKQWHQKILKAETPGLAKKLGNQCPIRYDWNQRRLIVMTKLVTLKFQQENLRSMLLDTENAVLIEGNYWNDTFWGICKGVGENHLGKILMQVREGIRNGFIL